MLRGMRLTVPGDLSKLAKSLATPKIARCSIMPSRVQGAAGWRRSSMKGLSVSTHWQGTPSRAVSASSSSR